MSLHQGWRNRPSHLQLPGSFSKGEGDWMFQCSQVTQAFKITVFAYEINPKHPQVFQRVSSEKAAKVRMAFSCSGCATVNSSERSSWPSYHPLQNDFYSLCICVRLLRERCLTTKFCRSHIF